MATQRPILPDPDAWLAAQAGQVLPDPDEWLRLQSAQSLPDPDEWLAKQKPAAPKPQQPQTLWQRVKGALFSPEPSGLAVESGRMTKEEAKARGYSGLWQPIIPFSKLTEPSFRAAQAGTLEVPPASSMGLAVQSGQMTPEEAAKRGAYVAHGIAKAVEGMTTPGSLALIGAIGPLTSPGLEFFGFLNSIGLGLDAAKNAYQGWQAAREAEKRGDAAEAVAGKTQAVADVFMALGFGSHAATGAWAKGKAYKGRIQRLRDGLNNSNLDADSLSYIQDYIAKSKEIEPADRRQLLAVAEDKATKIAEKAPLVVTPPPVKPEAVQSGTLATGPFPGPQQTIRAQVGAPMQQPLGAPPATPGTQPPGFNLPSQAGQRVTPKAQPPNLPGVQMPRATFDPTGPMLDIQRRTIFAIANDRAIPKDTVELIAGKSIRQLNAGEARALMTHLKNLTPAEIQGLKPVAETPLLDKASGDLLNQVIAQTEAKPPQATPEILKQPATEPPRSSVRFPMSSTPEATPVETILVRPTRKAPKFDPGKSLVNAIRSLGGIDPDRIRKAGLWTDWTERVPAGIRLMVQKKGATHGLDTLGGELGNLGYQGYDLPDTLMEALADPKKARRGLAEIAESSELEQAKAKILELENRLSETDFNPEELKAGGEEGKAPIREPGEEGFARIRDRERKTPLARSLMRVGIPSDLESLRGSGWMLPDGTVVEVYDHLPALDEASARASGGPESYSPSRPPWKKYHEITKDENLLRMGKYGKGFFVDFYGKPTEAQRAAINRYAWGNQDADIYWTDQSPTATEKEGYGYASLRARLAQQPEPELAGQEGFARYRDDQTKEMFPGEFSLTGGVARRPELPEQKAAAGAPPAERPQQLGMGAGPLFERAAEKRPREATPVEPKTREPWELTQEEYAESKGALKSWDDLREEAGQTGGKIKLTYPLDTSFGKPGDPITLSFEQAGAYGKPTVTNERTGKSIQVGFNMLPYQLLTLDHQALVKRALAEGKAVPEPVLKNYPKLTEKLPAETEASRTALEPSEQLAKLESSRPSRTAGPYTESDLSRFNSFTNYPTTLEKANAEFRTLSEGYRQTAIEQLKRWGIDEIPEDVERALSAVNHASVNLNREFARAKEIAPGAYIVGPSNYLKHARPEKARAIEARAVEAYDASKEYLSKAIHRHSPNAAISSDKANAPDLLQDKIAKAEKLQETMRQANAIVRKKGLTDEQKIEQIAALGMSRAAAAEVLKPDFAGRVGFADYQLQNNLANIKRMKERVSSIEQTRAKPTAETEFDGGRIVDNAEDNRIQLFFDSKPDLVMIARLKDRGFKWAPSVGAWQRQRTANARYATVNVLGKRLPQEEAGRFLGTRGTAPEEPVAATPEPSALPEPFRQAVEKAAPVEPEEVEGKIYQLPEEVAGPLAKVLGRTQAAKEPWQMTLDEWNREWQKTEINYSGTGGQGAGMGRATSAKGAEKAFEDLRAKIDWLKMNLRDVEGVPARHYQVVKEALRQGKPVPKEILAEYPELTKPRPVSEVAGQFAQAEVDRRAAIINETINRVVNGKGDWNEKRKQLGLEEFARPGMEDVPISKPELIMVRNRAMAETEQLTGLKASDAAKRAPTASKGRSLFGDDEGFAQFRESRLIDDDPQLKQILDRLKRAEQNAFRAPLDMLPRFGEEDVPGAVRHRVSWIRSADQALARYPETAPVAREIKHAARRKKSAMQHFDDLANQIVKESRIKRGSEEDRMVKDLLDEAYTHLTPEKLRESAAYRGDKEAAIKAAERFRNEIFDPIISQIRSDSELIEIIGKKGYIRGYFPHFMDAMKAKYGKEYLGMARALLPERFVSAFLKEREAEAWANNVSIYDVVPGYINSTMKTIHDIPAYNRANAVIKALPDGPAKDFAQWYADNYMGQPVAKEGLLVRNERYQKFSRWLANRYYDNLIGLNATTWAVNLGQTITNTFPELGAKYTAKGIKALFTEEGRRKFHESGLLFDYPGMESGILESGLKRKILHGGMAAGEYVNRGIAYLGGLEQAKEMKLVGRAAEMHAMDVVDKTQFAYGKESAIRYLENLPPDLKVFQTFPLKEAEFVRNLVADALKGGPTERAKLARFLMVNLALPAGLAAAGVPVGRMFIDVFDVLPKPFRTFELQRRLMTWLNNVRTGKVPPEKIPLDIVLGLWYAIGPAANATRKAIAAVGEGKKR